MSTDERMNAVLRAWREGVRGKERRIFRLEERIGLRMDAIETRMRRIRVPLNDWQILKRSGIDYFMTNKMFVWNDTNPWRKNNFWWEGPDGSRVLCVVPPGHFIGTVDPDQMNDQWEAVSDKPLIGESLYCFGWGDGGGGVDPEMLECGIRYGDVPGLPQTVFTTAISAFESIEAKAKSVSLPVVRDELYLEAHRGTYTSRGRLKKLNRIAQR